MTNSRVTIWHGPTALRKKIRLSYEMQSFSLFSGLQKKKRTSQWSLYFYGKYIIDIQLSAEKELLLKNCTKNPEHVISEDIIKCSFLTIKKKTIKTF